MPTISRIRLTNVIYEDNAKRYNDQIFRFDGENGIFLLENGGGKTVFLQTVLQAIIPHVSVAERKIKETLVLDNSPAHIAIEWILNEKPRRYVVTAVSLYMENNDLKSYKYVYTYGAEDKNSIEEIPFVVQTNNHKERPASKGEISDYYSRMKQQYINAETFIAIKDYHKYIEDNFKIIPGEWRKIGTINGSEGGIEEFFKHCKTTQQLVNNLLIPVVEDALSSSEKIDFVQTFEKQREHFKQNKRLSEDIEEFKSIKNKVDSYLQEYRKLHNADLEYSGVKQEAKALSKYVLEELESTEKIKLSLDEEWENYEEAKENYTHKALSLEIVKLDQTIKEYDEDRNELVKQGSDVLQQLNETKMRIQNIEITDLKVKQSKTSQLISSLEDQLMNVKQSEEESDLRDRICKAEALIHGSYLNMLDDFSKKMVIIHAQKERELEVLDNIKVKINEKNNDIIESKGNITGLEASIKTIAQGMEAIELKLYEPITEEGAPEFLVRLKTKIAEIEKELNQLQLRKEENRESIEQLDNMKEDYQKDLNELGSRLAGDKTTIVEMNRRQNGLIEELDAYFTNLGIFDSIYSKEPTIRQTVDDRLIKLKSEYEELLTRERLSSRLADIYEDLPYFAADSLLAKKMNKIINQVSYAEHGSLYIQKNLKTFGNDIEMIYKKYPFWANTVVTTESDKSKVIEYIRTLKNDLTYPVIVISTTMIQTIFDEGLDELVTNHAVFPETWKENLKQEQFELWKQKTIDEARAAKEEREAVGIKVQNIRSLKEKVESYFNIYPYDVYREIQSNIKAGEDKIKELKMKIAQLSADKTQKILEGEYIDKRLSELNQEKPIVENSIDLTGDFIKQGKNKSELGRRMQEEKRSFDRYNREYKRLQDELNRQEGIVEEAKNECSKLEYEIKRVEGDELFFKVKTVKPEFTDENLIVLKDKLQNLDKKLSGVTSLAREIEVKIDNERKNLEDIQNRLNRKEANAKFPVTKILSFDEHELDRLLGKADKLEQKVDVLRNKIEKAKLKIERFRGKRESKFEPIKEKYDELYVFEEDLIYVENQLAIEEVDIKKCYKELEERSVKNKELHNLYEKSKNELAVLAAKHGFSSTTLALYDRDSFINFEYDNGKMLDKLRDKLESKALDYTNMYMFIEGKKKDYLNFCRSTIKEPKLKDTAIKGVEKKKNYEELLDFQKNMEEILIKSIKIAEDDRRESDVELQTFLSHLMAYSKNVINEIEDIQYKTRIKVDEKTKQIFVFIIPKWDEITAKEELRRYINQLVSDYDREKENTEDDKESVREYIENKLSVKNLIIRILGDKTIKIKCRKVTNDLKVGQAPMTWESSNKWSGGEKWSKNMTLFLSILNYLAEKKQFISASGKRHRTVILDNPFGKASSKHVLDPVFFVAENLGFQMIAVTAHAEGQFVTDYFPVVYSGKLRESNDPDKQIMDISKTLNTAYFRSESPDSLRRFEESEQMSFLVD